MEARKAEVKDEVVDVVLEYLNKDIKLSKDVAGKFEAYTAYSGFIPLYKYLTEIYTPMGISLDHTPIGNNSRLAVTVVRPDEGPTILISLTIMSFPACCGMAIGYGLWFKGFEYSIEKLRGSGILPENFCLDTFQQLYSYGVAKYYRHYRVTKLIYTVSNQEYPEQEGFLRAMGFYDYSEPFVSCRTHHKLQTLVLDCYTDEEMRNAEKSYKSMYATKRLYR